MCIFDEMQCLKNANTKQTICSRLLIQAIRNGDKSNKILFVSGTPLDKSN